MTEGKTLHLIKLSVLSGVSCFAGYSVSVQYEDEFLVGDGGNLLASLMCGTRSRVRLWHKKEIAFELEYHAGASCTRPKVWEKNIFASRPLTCFIFTYHLESSGAEGFAVK